MVSLRDLLENRNCVISCTSMEEVYQVEEAVHQLKAPTVPRKWKESNQDFMNKLPIYVWLHSDFREEVVAWDHDLEYLMPNMPLCIPFWDLNLTDTNGFDIREVDGRIVIKEVNHG